MNLIHFCKVCGWIWLQIFIRIYTYCYLKLSSCKQRIIWPFHIYKYMLFLASSISSYNGMLSNTCACNTASLWWAFWCSIHWVTQHLKLVLFVGLYRNNFFSKSYPSMALVFHTTRNKLIALWKYDQLTFNSGVWMNLIPFCKASVQSGCKYA